MLSSDSTLLDTEHSYLQTDDSTTDAEPDWFDEDHEGEEPVGEPIADFEREIILEFQTQIRHNHFFYHTLVAQYRETGIIPGTDLEVNHFAIHHQVAYQLNEFQQHHIHQVLECAQCCQSLYSESDLLEPTSDEEDYADASDQDWTLLTPHPSAGITPVASSLTIINSGENQMQGTTQRPTTPSPSKEEV